MVARRFELAGDHAETRLRVIEGIDVDAFQYPQLALEGQQGFHRRAQAQITGHDQSVVVKRAVEPFLVDRIGGEHEVPAADHEIKDEVVIGAARCRCTTAATHEGEQTSRQHQGSRSESSAR